MRWTALEVQGVTQGPGSYGLVGVHCRLVENISIDGEEVRIGWVAGLGTGQRCIVLYRLGLGYTV